MKKEKQLNSISSNMSFEDIFGKSSSKETVINALRKDYSTYNQYLSYPDTFRQEILDFLTGSKSLCVTYDTFFKRILSPSLHPKRFEYFISSVLDMPVTILDILPNEGHMPTEKGSLVIMDLIIKTENGSIINVEMQKIGYSFPGQRAECYISDSVMRQLNIAKETYPDNFSYEKVNPSYLIILMKNSPSQFDSAYPEYIHTRQITYSSGISLPSLENVRYISLDTFNKVMHNRNINTDLEAWLTFFSSTDPARINELIHKYPIFIDMYKEIATLRHDMKGVIGMYSKILSECDHYTELYMIDVMKNEIKELEKTITIHKGTIADYEGTIADYEGTIADYEGTIADYEGTIADYKDALSKRDDIISDKDKTIAQLQQQLELASH